MTLNSATLFLWQPTVNWAPAPCQPCPGQAGSIAAPTCQLAYIARFSGASIAEKLQPI